VDAAVTAVDPNVQRDADYALSKALMDKMSIIPLWAGAVGVIYQTFPSLG